MSRDPRTVSWPHDPLQMQGIQRLRHLKGDVCTSGTLSSRVSTKSAGTDLLLGTVILETRCQRHVYKCKTAHSETFSRLLREIERNIGRRPGLVSRPINSPATSMVETVTLVSYSPRNHFHDATLLEWRG